MAPPRVDARLANLIVQLRDKEKMKFEAIGNHVRMHPYSVSRVYYRTKNPKALNKAGRPRKTDIR